MPRYNRINSLKRKSLKRKSFKRKSFKRKSLKRKSLKRKSLKKRSFRRRNNLRGGAAGAGAAPIHGYPDLNEVGVTQIMTSDVARRLGDQEGLFDIDNEANVINILQDNGMKLRFANPNLRNNENVVIAAVTNDRRAFKYASHQLRGQQNIINAAMGGPPGADNISDNDFWHVYSSISEASGLKAQYDAKANAIATAELEDM